MHAIGFDFVSIVDDDESVRTGTRALLRSAGFHVESFKSAEDFLQSGAINETNCLILDMHMPGIGGLELQHQLKAAQCTVPVIFVTGHDGDDNRRTALNRGALNVFGKPFNGDVLVAAIRSAIGGIARREK